MQILSYAKAHLTSLSIALSGIALIGCSGVGAQILTATLGSHLANTVLGPATANASSAPKSTTPDPVQQKLGGVTDSKTFAAAEKSAELAGTGASAAGVVALVPGASAYGQVAQAVLAEYNATLKQELDDIRARQQAADAKQGDAPTNLDIWKAIGGSVIAALGAFELRRKATAAAPATPAAA
jgi:hypothetical protein